METLKTAHPAHIPASLGGGWGGSLRPVLASFILNEIWEMAQMSAYVETTGDPWKSTLGRCTSAAVGDVGIILGVYAVDVLTAGDLGWSLRGQWNNYAIAALLGWLLRR